MLKIWNILRATCLSFNLTHWLESPGNKAACCSRRGTAGDKCMKYPA
ncbi:MAG: hypothetical protein J7578_25690 [Chitinophagaceae bacterium]|nr:hypothetical protein [Chitinophagaceae bacterium]